MCGGSKLPPKTPRSTSATGNAQVHFARQLELLVTELFERARVDGDVDGAFLILEQHHAAARERTRREEPTATNALDHRLVTLAEEQQRCRQDVFLFEVSLVVNHQGH